MPELRTEATVGELKRLLDDYGDHLTVRIQKSSGAFANIHGVDDEPDPADGSPMVVLWSHDL